MSGGNEMSQQRHGQGPILRFTKMHGLGNDFMVVDAISQPFRLGPDTIRELADRNFGIGFDQLLVVVHRAAGCGFSLPSQCRWLGSRAVRQRRPLLCTLCADQRLTNKRVIRYIRQGCD